MSLIDSPRFVKFSKIANFNFRESWFLFFFYFLRFVTLPLLKFLSMEKVFKIDLNLQTFFSSIFICIFRRHPLLINCHYHQISFALKQVVPVSYYKWHCLFIAPIIATISISLTVNWKEDLANECWWKVGSC